MNEREATGGAPEGELERALAELAAAERRLHPRPGDALVARVLADAAAEAAAVAARPAPARARRPGFVARLLVRLGGGFLAGSAGPRLAAALLVLALVGGFGAGFATAPGPAADLALLGADGFDMMGAGEVDLAGLF